MSFGAERRKNERSVTKIALRIFSSYYQAIGKDGEKNVFWSINEEVQERTMFKFSSNQFAYPEKRLTIDEMLAKFINEGMREHEEIGIFIIELKTTNELLLKEQNNLINELKIEVHQLSKVLSNV
nr:retrotransposon Gag protein [Tanacetum cinerariifolium]